MELKWLSKNCVQFARCITKIDRTRVDDAEDLDFVMLMEFVIIQFKLL